MHDLLHAMFGAILVFLGVIAGACADRIRGLHFHRERAARRDWSDTAKRSQVGQAPTDAHAAMARDVAKALVTAGYSKLEAAKAVEACAGSETSTIEGWTRAALRKCIKAAA